MNREKAAVIGAGSWGTALALLLAEKGHDVFLWSHRGEHREAMNRERQNRKYLPGHPFPENITISEDTAVVKNTPLVVMVVPSHGFREAFSSLAPHLVSESHVISATKGIENKTFLTMTGVMNQVMEQTGRAGEVNLGVLAGPSFAREVVNHVPTAVTVAFKDKTASTWVQQRLYTDRFRVYAATDVIGQELAGALKNIIAIAAGIADGLGFGSNTRAALITRGLAEIVRLGVKMGANPLTFSGLAGMGDLVLTCTGDLSRNRHVGLELGRGRKIKEILSAMDMVAEGVKTTRSAHDLAVGVGVEMPIVEQVFQVIYHDKPCVDAVRELLTREQKIEMDLSLP